MSYKVRTRDEHFQNDGTPKRILALDGGGLRGILTLGYLARIEALLRDRVGGDPGFRLCHYFDLIAGTSTGAIIAAALASGWTVAEAKDAYLKLGEKIFRKSLFRKGLFRAKYDDAALIAELQRLLGKKTLLRDDSLKTGLLVVTKRLDSGSPWPISNNPRGKYFEASADSKAIANGDYPLWQVVRASTAAPMFFEDEKITIVSQKGKDPVVGCFVDGGVSPFNNPSLQALMYATLEGYRVRWPLGADKVLLVSLGTGSRDPSVTPTWIDAKQGVKSLVALMDDCAALMETLLQWMSASPTARRIDRELGDLRNDHLADQPLVSYLRYNLELTPPAIAGLRPGMTDKEVVELSAMDDPANMDVLHELGIKHALRSIHAEDFQANFDLT